MEAGRMKREQAHEIRKKSKREEEPKTLIALNASRFPYARTWDLL
jgi:hypothetical protein